MARSLLSIANLSGQELDAIIDKARSLKSVLGASEKTSSMSNDQHTYATSTNTLRNKIVGLFFEKPSTGTRTSFEVATLRLGGQAVYLSCAELQLSRRETIRDTARILGNYLDCIVATVNAHDILVKLSQYSRIPVINALSDLEHPTQIISDLFTIIEAKGKLEGLNLAYVGGGSSICSSLLLGAAITGMNMSVACPKGHEPEEIVLRKARRIAETTGSKLSVVREPSDSTRAADVLYSDVWVSMDQDKEKQKRGRAFPRYQINSELLKTAAQDALVMHPLPAHRGLEITDVVLEGKQSIVWTQAENKLYSAASIFDFLLH